jgi:hypothetical protein
MTVAKVKGRYDLFEKLPGLFDGETRLFDEVIEQLSARDVLQHKVSDLKAFIFNLFNYLFEK